MSIMSFSQFITACITLVFSQSGHCAVPFCFATRSIKYKQNPHWVDELLAKHSHRFELLFSDFFAFILGQTMALDRKNKYLKGYNYEMYETLYDRMYDNFSVFVDFALNNIIVLDVETLYSGMSTQLKKFMKGYEYAVSENLEFLCENASYDFSPRIFSFYDIVFHSNEYDYIRKNYQEQEEYWYEYETEPIYLKTESTDLKHLNAVNRSRKVQGHRQDYEQHLFNKGLNKKKRERGHFPRKSHKNDHYW
jgi:hypothetical protein